jgi:hypothetical protein
MNRRVPVFKDTEGTPCAMAYLIEMSGNQDLVDSVAAIDNHVLINSIQNGPVFDWIANSGLTKVEAARIQPSYGPCGMGDCSNHIYEFLPIIASTVGFIVLEWLSYTISTWLVPHDRIKRLVFWLYFTMNNILISFVLMLIFGWLSQVLYRFFTYNF